MSLWTTSSNLQRLCSNAVMRTAGSLLGGMKQACTLILRRREGIYRYTPRRYYWSPRGPRDLKFACEINGGVGTTLPVVATDSEYGVDLNCRLTFATAAWNTLKEIAELLGVDWRTVPAKVLDALGKRFVCKKCTFGHGGDRLVKPAMDWRECVRTPS